MICIQKYLRRCVLISAIYFAMHKNGLMESYKVRYMYEYLINMYSKMLMAQTRFKF